MIRLLPGDGRTIDLMPWWFRFTLDASTDYLFGESVESLLNPKVPPKKGRFSDGRRPLQKLFRQSKKYKPSAPESVPFGASTTPNPSPLQSLSSTISSNHSSNAPSSNAAKTSPPQRKPRARKSISRIRCRSLRLTARSCGISWCRRCWRGGIRRRVRFRGCFTSWRFILMFMRG
jgi:hypothetical protein